MCVFKGGLGTLRLCLSRRGVQWDGENVLACAQGAPFCLCFIGQTVHGAPSRRPRTVVPAGGWKQVPDDLTRPTLLVTLCLAPSPTTQSLQADSITLESRAPEGGPCTLQDVCL